MASGFQYDAIADACDWTHEIKDGRIIGDARGRACNPEICRDLAPRSKAAVGRVGEVIVPKAESIVKRNAKHFRAFPVEIFQDSAFA